MEFCKSLFWICFLIIMKITFIFDDLSPTFKFQELTKSVRYFGLAVWNNISLEISIKSLNTFKTEIRKWKPKNF